jgi:anti-sigma factor RsiW
MNCRDLKDIADSYLSNELLVETNHEILRHLESCRDCRHELGERRELRARLKHAVRSEAEGTVDPNFAARAVIGLRESAQKQRYFAGIPALVAAMAAMLLIGAGVFFIRSGDVDNRAAVTPAPANANPAGRTNGSETAAIPAELAEIRNDAIEDHKNCALTHNLKERPIPLSEAAKKYGAANAGFDEAVIRPIKAAFGEDSRFIKAHHCLINGRGFAHAVLEFKGTVVSVLMTKGGPGSGFDESFISCRSQDGLRVACFSAGGYSMFVVSALEEPENLLLARTIADSLSGHVQGAAARVRA